MMTRIKQVEALEREKNKIWREKEIKKRTWMRNGHLPDEEDRSTWRVTYSLTFHLSSNTLSICCHGVLRTNQHLSLSVGLSCRALQDHVRTAFVIYLSVHQLWTRSSDQQTQNPSWSLTDGRMMQSENRDKRGKTQGLTTRFPFSFIMTTRLYLLLLWPLDFPLVLLWPLDFPLVLLWPLDYTYFYYDH